MGVFMDRQPDRGYTIDTWKTNVLEMNGTKAI